MNSLLDDANRVRTLTQEWKRKQRVRLNLEVQRGVGQFQPKLALWQPAGTRV